MGSSLSRDITQRALRLASTETCHSTMIDRRPSTFMQDGRWEITSAASRNQFDVASNTASGIAINAMPSSFNLLNLPWDRSRDRHLSYRAGHKLDAALTAQYYYGPHGARSLDPLLRSWVSSLVTSIIAPRGFTHKMQTPKHHRRRRTHVRPSSRSGAYFVQTL